jgi:hypothetical protein
MSIIMKVSYMKSNNSYIFIMLYLQFLSALKFHKENPTYGARPHYNKMKSLLNDIDHE